MTSASQEQAIREIAYSKWEQAGWPIGDGVNFWLEAEQELGGEQCESACAHDSNGDSSGSSSICDPPPLLLAKVKANSRKKAG